MVSIGAVYEIPDACPVTMLGVEFNKLHVGSYFHNYKCFLETKFMKSTDYDIRRSGLGSDSAPPRLF